MSSNVRQQPTGVPRDFVDGRDFATSELIQNQRLEINQGDLRRVMSSSDGDNEGHAREKVCPSQSSCSNCAEVLHELSNVLTGVLINAQFLGWKLPPYSHLKRPVREMERNAQRGGELLKRTMRTSTTLRASG